MKKILIILGMVTCLAGMTACSETQADSAQDDFAIPEETVIAIADSMIEDISQVVDEGLQDQYASNEVVSGWLQSWEMLLPELGTYSGITDHKVSRQEDGISVEMTLDGSDHDAIATIVLNEQGYVTSFHLDTIKSFKELMTNAALNTLLGMGTVFIVLILIAGLISMFKIIPSLQEKFSKKKEPAVSAAPAPVPAVSAAAQQSAREDDNELAAVIAAAIAAYESENGAAAPGDFIVRSIKRRGGKWQRA